LKLHNLVSQWYEDKQNVEEMRGWNPALKTWEREVITHFSSGARILDIGCGLGREAFEISELTQYARQAGFEVILCEKGRICKLEDGTVLHCLCRKRQADQEKQAAY